MRKQEMALLVYEALGRILVGTEFCLKKSEECFARKIVNGRQTIGIALYNYNPDFYVAIVLTTRLDAAEGIYHRFADVQPQHRELTVTAITLLEHFTGVDKYCVTTPEDVTAVFNSLSGVIREKVLPFLDRNTDVEGLDHSVNCQQPSMDISQDPAGAMHAVILSRLSKNGAFENVVSKCRTRMQLTAEEKHPFNDLVLYLRSL